MNSENGCCLCPSDWSRNPGQFFSSALLFNPRIAKKWVEDQTLILNHVTLTSTFSVIPREIPQIMAEFGLKYFLDDIRCKLDFTFTESRGISLYTMCLLSCFQATTINPSNTKWMKLKHRAIKYMGLSCSLSWLVHLLLTSWHLWQWQALVTEAMPLRNWLLGIAPPLSGTIATALYMLLLVFTDDLCLGLMSWVSPSMVSMLYRHKRQIQYIHDAQHSLRISPETRATQTILILVCTFVNFYSISFILVLYSALFDNPGLWVINIIAILKTCFPIFCHYVLISSNSSASKLSLPCWWKR